MSDFVTISVLYAIGSLIILIIFTTLLQNLFCAQHDAHGSQHKYIDNRSRRTSDEPHHHRTRSSSFVTSNNPNTTSENSVTTTTSPSAITASNASRTRSRSSSFSFSRRASVPQAVNHLVSSMKSMLYQMEHRGYQHSNEIQLLVRCAFIFSCFGFLIFASILCIYFTIESVTENGPLHDTHHDLKFIAVLFYIIGKYALYVGSSARLYYSLEGGVFQYHASVYMMLFFYFVIHLLIAVCGIILLYMQLYLLCAICVVIFYVMDAFYLVLLYTLFTKQLLKVLSNTAAYVSSSPSISPTSINEPPQLQITSAVQTEQKTNASLDANKSTKQRAYIGKHQISGMEYVTKHTVLVFCSVLSALVMSVMIGSLCDAFIKQFNVTVIIHILWCADCVVNTCSIYLNFIFGSWMYQHLCSVCHRITAKMCNERTTKKVPNASTGHSNNIL